MKTGELPWLRGHHGPGAVPEDFGLCHTPMKLPEGSDVPKVTPLAGDISRGYTSRHC